MKHLSHASVNSKHANSPPYPPPPHSSRRLSGIGRLVRASCGEFVTKPLPGVGHFSVLLELLNIVPIATSKLY